MLSLHIEDAVAHLVIDRPARHNAFDWAMWAQVPGLVTQASADRHVRVLVVLSATPGIFSAGADLAEMAAHREDEVWLQGLHDAIGAAQQALVTAPMPTLAFIDGDCIGGGMAVALACDQRLATTRARFGVTPARLGLVYPVHDTALLHDLVGPGQAARLLFSGALIDLPEALRIGLVEAQAEDWQDTAHAIAGNAAYSLRALKQILQQVRSGARHNDAASRTQFVNAFAQDDFARRLERFFARS